MTQKLAYYKIYDCMMNTDKSEIKCQSFSWKYKKNESKIVSFYNILEVVQKTTNDTKRAEIELAAFIANNLSFDIMDSLVPLCKNIFPDSRITTKLASK